MIDRRILPLGIYPDALPTGEFVYGQMTADLVTQHLVTHLGVIPLPAAAIVPDEPPPRVRLMFNRITNVGGFQITSSGHGVPIQFHWRAGTWFSLPPVNGTQGALFGPDGTLHRVEPGPNVESQGIRYFDPIRGLVYGSPTYNPDTQLARELGIKRLYGWTKIGDIAVGQGGDGGCLIQYLGQHYRLIDGDVQFVQFKMLGDRLAIAGTRFAQRDVFVAFLDVADITSLPQDIPSVPNTGPVVDIGRRMLMAFFAGAHNAPTAWQTTISPQSLPGNSYLAVSSDEQISGIVFSKDGQQFAQYVAAEQAGQNIAEEIAKAKQRHPTLPTIAYWTRQDHGGPVPPGEFVGVELYCGIDELATFEARSRAAVARVPRAVIIPQCFTSNAHLTTDLKSLVPIFSRIARDMGNVYGILPFSGPGRKSGLQDQDLQLWELWDRVAAGIIGLPPIFVLPQPEPEVPPVANGPSLHVWTKEEFPQVVEARRTFLKDPSWIPDPDWIILQMARRYGFGLPPGENPWTLQKMIDHELNPEGH